MRQKKGTLHYITIGFMVLILVIVSVSILKLWSVETRIGEKNEFEVSHGFYKAQSDILHDACDYLTDQSRSFVYSEDEVYLLDYCREVEETRRRENAIQELELRNLPQEDMRLIYLAKENSEELMLLEKKAMRLVEEARGTSPADMPVLLRDVTLSEAEQSMSPEQKRDMGRSLMLSPEYRDIRNSIGENLRTFQAQMQQQRDNITDSATKAAKQALYEVQILNILLVILVLSEVVIFYINVVIPFLRYSRELSRIDTENGKVLTPTGFKEMRKFANMFNSVYSDLLEEKKKLETLSSTDCLTGIDNRAALDGRIAGLLEKREQNIGLLMIDIDNFKLFNDGFGHLLGDQVLIEMGRCFERAALKEGGTAGRLGGEEFVIVVPDATVSQLEDLASGILDGAMNIHAHVPALGIDGIRTTVSIGSTIWPKGRPGDVKSIIRQADVALYQAKGRGKNQHIMFSEEEALYDRLERETQRQIEVESDLFRALEKEEFIPFFQPKYELDTGMICGAEALVRWEHREKGFLYPDYFVPVLEKDGFITKIDFVMFEKICASIKEWEKQGLPAIPVSCNFSRLNFGKQTIVRKLSEITEKYGISPSRIQVELTENSLIERDAIISMEEELAQLREVGFAIAIDDFGTGYSSLAMLNELTVDVLKVDKSFLHRDLNLKENQLLLSGILFIADTMHLKTVVEGVETAEQAELLRLLGYKVAQGFYFSRPVTKREFEKLLREQGEKEA